jgi:hypothetical protein
MKNQGCRLITRVVFLTGAIMLMAMSNSVAAQQPGGRPEGRPDLKRDQREREQREAVLRTAEARVAVAKLDEKRIEAAVTQVREDFKQIQIVRNEIARHLLSEKPLDYKLISNKAGDVNKRADRLKTLLMPPVPEDKAKSQKSAVEIGGAEMQGALVRLCNLIDGFVENPVLKTPGRVDVEQSTKAGGDLLSIVELSDNIKRSAEKLNKTSR